MWFDDLKEGPGKYYYFSKRQSYIGEWTKGQPRCGTIQNLAPIEGEHQTLLPINCLVNPAEIIKLEKESIRQGRVTLLTSI